MPSPLQQMLLTAETALRPPYHSFCAWLWFGFETDAVVGEEEVQTLQQGSFVHWQPLVRGVRTLGPRPRAPAQPNNLGSSLRGSVPILQSHFRCVHLTAVPLQYSESFQAWLLGWVLAAEYRTEEDSLLRTKHSLVASKMSHLEPAGTSSVE